jgi:hypothetical protein
MLKNIKCGLITYADKNFLKSKIRILEEARKFKEFYKIKSFGIQDLDVSFKEKFKKILSFSRIAGYGIWRPYIIKKFLIDANPDYLVYLDAGCTINIEGKKRFFEYIKILNNTDCGIISMELKGANKKGQTHTEKFWTNKEIFEYFNLSLDSKIALSNQYLDGVLIMKNNVNLNKIIDIWLKSVHDNPYMFTDVFNNNQEVYFKDNRHEQSVFSIIRKIYGSFVIDNEINFKFFGSEESLKYPFWATRYRG